MKTAVLACNTIRDELLLAESRVQSGYEIFWIESALHNFPDKLNTQIRKGLDTLDGYDRVLLAFGFCGNAIDRIETGSFELIIPRVDDCISLLFGSVGQRATRTKGRHGIFFTGGWLQHETNIWAEYEHTLKKYGPRKTAWIVEMLYGPYDLLGVVDTGAFNVDSILDQTRRMAETFHLEHKIFPGTTDYLEKLLTGPWEENYFLRIAPHDKLKTDMLVLASNAEGFL
jgi:hypothetical protein